MWIGDEYKYNVGVLRVIASHYETLYTDGIPFLLGIIDNPFDVAEYKADFDIAFNALGFREREIIRCDMEGVGYYQMEQMGFDKPKKFLRETYAKMADYLNYTGVYFVRNLTNRKPVV